MTELYSLKYQDFVILVKWFYVQILLMVKQLNIIESIAID